MANLKEEVEALRAIAAELTAQVEDLKPLEGKLAAALKTIDELNATIADQKKELGALRGQAAEFKGKLPIDQEELQDLIKDTINESFKDVKIAMPGVAGDGGDFAGDDFAEEGAGEAAAPSGDEFGFSESGKDEFGF